MRSKFIVICSLVSLLAVWPVQAADSVEPSSTSITNIRDEADQTIPGEFFVDSTLLLTNNVMFSDSVGITNQGLDGITIEVRVGRPSTNVLFLGTPIVTNLGTWWVSFPVPSDVIADQFNVQVKIIDLQTNTFIYPWKKFNTKDALE